MPGVTVVALFVLVIDRLDDSAIVSVSVAVLLPLDGSVTPAGAVTLAVLTRVPVASARTVAMTVNVAVPFAARLTVVFMSPVPLGRVQPEPAEAVHVHVALLNAAGNASVTVAPLIELGPLLRAMIV